jgi:hypothetical protein
MLITAGVKCKVKKASVVDHHARSLFCIILASLLAQERITYISSTPPAFFQSPVFEYITLHYITLHYININITNINIIHHGLHDD